MNNVATTLDLSDNTPSIASSAMLVELSISSWTGRKKDKLASKEITDAHGADAAVASVNKTLLSDCEQLRNIKQFIGEVRNHVHYHMTMPWSDTGIRLLPTEMFFDYQDAITHYEGLIHAEVDSLIDDFEHQKAKAANKLGSLFNAEDYPSAEELRDKFKFRVTYTNVPEAGDFRLDLPQEAVATLKANYEDAFTSRIEQAMNDIWHRVHEALSNMSARLGYNDDGKALVFRDSLVENAMELVDLMKKCNVTNDSQMSALGDKLSDALLGVSADGLREDHTFRDQKKKDIDELLKQLPSLDL